MQCSVTEKLLKDTNGRQARGGAVLPLREQKRAPLLSALSKKGTSHVTYSKSTNIGNAVT